MNFKKFLAVLMTAVMTMCAMAMPAFAAVSPTAPRQTCGVCGTVFSAFEAQGFVTYEEYFSVSSIPEITNNYMTFRYNSSSTPNVCACNGNPICLSCLEKKVNEYKASHEDTSSTETSSTTTNVTASVNSNCTIVIPESITLAKADNVAGSGEYTKSFEVKVNGDVPEDATVTITANNPTLKATGAKDVTAKLTMDKTQWNRTDIIAKSGEGTVSNCNLKATLTPGTWTGTMTYNIVLTGKFDLTA